MSDQLQNEQTEEQNQADFLAGFNSVHAPDDGNRPSPEAVQATPVAEQQSAADQNRQATAEEPPAQQAEKTKEESKLFGLSESEIKTLIERSAKVDSLEKQLRSAHGKFGELNQTVQSLLQKQTTKPQETPAEPSASAVSDADLAQYEKDYPEIVAIAKKIAGAMAKPGSSAEPQAAPQFEASDMAQTQDFAPADADPVEAKHEQEITIASSVLDLTRKGWRETIASSDFNQWLESQPQDVRLAFDTTTRAEVFAGVLDQFNDWKAKAQDKGAKSKKRLEDALLPSGNAPKVSHAPTPQDEFEAGFNAIRSQYQ